MSLGSSAASPQQSPGRPPADAARQEWIYRGAAALLLLVLLWFSFRNQNDAALFLLMAPMIVGALLAAMRLPAVSGAVDSIEVRFSRGSARAAGRDGKFARFFQRPFYKSCLAIWRWTAPIADPHLRAAVRVAALIVVCGVAAALLLSAVYVIVAIVVLMIALAILAWALSLSSSSQSSGRRTTVTRYTSDWLGRPKQDHFDGSGMKIGESRGDTDFLGKPKMVHTDASGQKTGESKPDTDWLGSPKTVHTDAEGRKVGESRPDTDWLGQPKTVHTDVDGKIIGESQQETDWLGQPKTVRRDR